MSDQPLAIGCDILTPITDWLMLFGDHSHFGPLLCLLISPWVPLTKAGLHGAPLVLYMSPASSVA